VATTPPLRGGGEGLGDSEVGHHRVTTREQHVLGLEVPVHDALRVRVRERVGQLAHEAHDVAYGKRAGPSEPRPERFALDVGHRVVRQPRDLARGVERHHVGVLQPGGESDLALEARGRDAGGEVGGEDLDDDAAAEPRVLGDEDPRHAAAAELALEGVGRAERGLQSVAEEIGHGCGGSGRGRARPR
jgi:hypothetical protein